MPIFNPKAFDPKYRREYWQNVVARLKAFFSRRREEPEDPYANVMAPLKPRPHRGSAAAVLELPDE